MEPKISWLLYQAYLHQVPAQPDGRKMPPAKLSDDVISIVE